MTGVQTCALPICFPVTIQEDEILIYKEKYLMFMLSSKGKMRKDTEVDEFLSDLTKEHTHIRRRLDSILLKSLTEEELTRTQKRIKELQEELKKQEVELTQALNDFGKMEDTAMKRATQNRVSSSFDLFSEEDEIDGIEVYQNAENEEED